MTNDINKIEDYYSKLIYILLGGILIIKYDHHDCYIITSTKKVIKVDKLIAIALHETTYLIKTDNPYSNEKYITRNKDYDINLMYIRKKYPVVWNIVWRKFKIYKMLNG